MALREQFPWGRKALLAVAAALAGGSTFTSCDTRIKTAVADGTRQFILSLFDPSVILADSQSNNIFLP